MAFDLNALMQDPQFQMGIGLLGAGNPRERGLLEAYKMMQAQQSRKMEEEKYKQEIEYRRAMTELERMKTTQYGKQVEAQEAAIKRDAEARQSMEPIMQALQQRLLRQGGQQPSIGQLPAPGQQPTLQPPVAPGQPAPQQQASLSPQAAQPDLSRGPVVGQPGIVPQLPVGQSLEQAAPVPKPPDPVSGFFRERWLPVEDGIDPQTGAFKTSPKGAIGPAQVLPSTAPEAARLAGLPFDDNRFRTDPKYNVAIGEAYFRKQYDDFNDIGKAAAAYNAGPKRVKEAEQRAKRAGNEATWLVYMPRETQIAVNMSLNGRTGLNTPVVPKEALNPDATLAMDLQIAGGLWKARVGKDPGGAISDIGKAFADKQAAEASSERARAATKQADVAERSETRQAATATEERSMKRAQEWRNFSSTTVNLDLLDEKINKLQSMPGTARIFGVTGAFPDAPGTPAADARALHTSIVSQQAKETLQAVRDASKTGGAFGNVSNYDVQLLQTAIQNLEKAQSYESGIAAMNDVKKYMAKIRNTAVEAFEVAHGESPYANLGAPKGTRFHKLDEKTGKRVFKLPDGKLMREE